jgi:hypothetical protein
VNDLLDTNLIWSVEATLSRVATLKRLDAPARQVLVLDPEDSPICRQDALQEPPRLERGAPCPYDTRVQSAIRGAEPARTRSRSCRASWRERLTGGPPETPGYASLPKNQP